MPNAMRAGFERWWSEWPAVRRTGKNRAARAYVQARREASEIELLDGVRRTHFDLTRPRYIPHPASWLNAGCWKDDPEVHRPPPGPLDYIRDFVRGECQPATEAD
jgi:hypothetical protein